MFSECGVSENAKIVMARLSRFKADILARTLAKEARNGTVGCQVKDIFGIKKAAKYEGPLKVPKVIFSKI